MTDTAHVELADWFDGVHRKGKNLAAGQETIMYQVPLPKIGKTGLISVLRQFHRDFHVRLTVRGRLHDERKRKTFSNLEGIDFDKIHTITLTVDDRKLEAKLTSEQRLQQLRAAEAMVDAFLKQLSRASEQEQVYMFPPTDTPAGAPAAPKTPGKGMSAVPAVPKAGGSVPAAPAAGTAGSQTTKTPTDSNLVTRLVCGRGYCVILWCVSFCCCSIASNIFLSCLPYLVLWVLSLGFHRVASD